MTAASKELDTMSTLVNQSFHNYGSGDAEVAQQLHLASATRPARAARCCPASSAAARTDRSLTRPSQLLPSRKAR